LNNSEQGIPDRPASSGEEASDAGPRVAVAIPCYNEAAAIVRVVEEWRAALPASEIVVFDNNSSDGSGELARSAGASVIEVREQGKGCVVQAIFRTLGDRAAVVLIDGDGTYPASEVQRLLQPVLGGVADVCVGARRPVETSGAMSPVRWLGNLMIRLAFRWFVGRGSADPLSGYRVFGPRFLRVVRPRATGFEIEVELETLTLRQDLRSTSIPVPYYPRIAGSYSKLSPLRDGRRILNTIIKFGLSPSTGFKK
jgi:glycosyltransferase involved in cell wall biosynthesis